MVPAWKGSSTWQKIWIQDQAPSSFSAVLAGRLQDLEVSEELLWSLGQSAEVVLRCCKTGLVVAILLAECGRAHPGCSRWQCGTYSRMRVIWAT